MFGVCRREFGQPSILAKTAKNKAIAKDRLITSNFCARFLIIFDHCRKINSK
jgi:hypothetical protein